MPRITLSYFEECGLTELAARIGYAVAVGDLLPDDARPVIEDATLDYILRIRNPRTREGKAYRQRYNLPANYCLPICDAVAASNEEADHARRALEIYEAAARKMYHHPDEDYSRMLFLDALLDTHGVEGFADPDDCRGGCSYLNTGDSYIPGPWLLPDGRILRLDLEQASRHPALARLLR